MTDVYQSALNFGPAQASDGNGGVTPPAEPRPLSRGGERLFEVLRWYFGKFKRVFPAQAKLAEMMKLTVRQIQRYVKELRELGLVKVQKCGHHPAEYLFQPEAIERRNVGSASCLRRVYDVFASGLKPRHPYSLSSPVSVASHPSASENTPDRKPPGRAKTVLERMMTKYGLSS